jgi:hypothetical protein
VLGSNPVPLGQNLVFGGGASSPAPPWGVRQTHPHSVVDASPTHWYTKLVVVFTSRPTQPFSTYQIHPKLLVAFLSVLLNPAEGGRCRRKLLPTVTTRHTSPSSAFPVIVLGGTMSQPAVHHGASMATKADCLNTNDANAISCLVSFYTRRFNLLRYGLLTNNWCIWILGAWWFQSWDAGHVFGWPKNWSNLYQCIS